jgi:pentatricopeptide repeat protein
LVRNAILEGDRIVAVASTLGDRLWPVSTVEGVISACTARLPGQKVTMRFERPLVNLEKAAAAAASVDENQVMASTTALPSVDAMTQVDAPMAPEKITRLLKGCREVLRRYPAPEKKSEGNDKNFVGKYAVPAMVADKVIDAVASASTSFDAPTLSMVMNAFLSCDQASGAIRIFEAATGAKADGSSDAVETMIMGKDRGVLVASPDALNLYTASSLMRALAMNGDISSAKRILAALEGHGGTIVDMKEVASWPGTGEGGSIVPDVMCYNIALKAASMAVGGFADLLSIFTSMSDGKQDQSDRPAKDIVSYNTVIVALTNADKTKEAFDMFSRMKKAGIKPDKFTYTSLIKACSRPIDMQELLYDMKEKGVKPDIVTYNTMIRTLCDRLQWFEAKKLIYDMETNGIAPNSMTYGFLMSGLMKAEKYSAALILFESACADSRTTPLTENVQLYTSAITAAASLRNHGKAFNLVNRMNMAGVQPNLQTMTAVMCSCLSSGEPNLAVEVYKKIDKPDGIAMSKGLEAMCFEGQFEEVATALHAQWRKRGSVMSGKQIMQGYNQLLRQALEQGDLTFARKALTQFLHMGFIPSKAMYLTIIESLNLVPPKKKDLPFVKDVPEENFYFLLFILDITRGRNLAIDGFFYSSMLACSARMGPLRRKVGSLMAEARALSNSDAALLVKKGMKDADEVVAQAEIGWEDLLRNYDEYKEQNSIRPPRLTVTISKALVRSVLFAEQLVTYNGVRKSSSSSRRAKQPNKFAAAATN